MKRTFILIALSAALILSVAGNALAAKTPKTGGKGAGKGLDGTISKATTNMIVVQLGEGKGVSNAQIGDTTVITLDGKPATTNDLARGQTVHVTVSGGKASKIEASTAPK
jgi:hypothetical protein